MLDDIENIIKQHTSTRLNQIDKAVNEHSILRSLKRHWEGITLLIALVVLVGEVIEWYSKEQEERKTHGHQVQLTN